MIGQRWGSFEFNSDFKRIFTVWLAVEDNPVVRIFVRPHFHVFFQPSWSTSETQSYKRLNTFSNTETDGNLNYHHWFVHIEWLRERKHIESPNTKFEIQIQRKNLKKDANLTDLTCNGVGWWKQLIGREMMDPFYCCTLSIQIQIHALYTNTNTHSLYKYKYK